MAIAFNKKIIPLDGNVERILKQLSKDKKRMNSKNNFILLNSIGNSYISDDIEINLIKNTISNL